jgi:hypothetical protein
MAPLDKLAKLIDLPATAELPPDAALECRDEIKRLLARLPRRFEPRQETSSRAASCRISMLNPDPAASGDVS